VTITGDIGRWIQRREDGTFAPVEEARGGGNPNLPRSW